MLDFIDAFGHCVNVITPVWYIYILDTLIPLQLFTNFWDLKKFKGSRFSFSGFDYQQPRAKSRVFSFRFVYLKFSETRLIHQREWTGKKDYDERSGFLWLKMWLLQVMRVISSLCALRLTKSSPATCKAFQNSPLPLRVCLCVYACVSYQMLRKWCRKCE